jgi:hypothetical protein
MTDLARLYYTLDLPTAYSTEDKLRAAVRGRAKPVGGVRQWLETQGAYTMHRTLRKKFPRNPYTVSNLMEVWECDLIIVTNLARYNDSYRYIRSAIDVFSKYFHLVTLNSKTGRLLPRRLVRSSLMLDIQSHLRADLLPYKRTSVVSF